MKIPTTLAALLLGTAFAQSPTVISIDGSSTVYPISLAMAEEFGVENEGARVTVNFSGTGGGFERFCRGETQINDASRVIEEDEIAACEENGVEFIELPIAADALTVVVNSENDWATCVTVEQLAQVWGPDSAVQNWSDVDETWPGEPMDLFGPGTDSGTFDYFTDAVNGEEGAIRTDFSPSEDDNVIAQGVQNNPYALGYFGYAYYIENEDTLKALEIDSGEGCVAPSPETVEDGTYTPLSRPLFIYVNRDEADSSPVLQDFVDFYLAEDSRELIEDTGYVTYGDDIYPAVQERFTARTAGSAFGDFAPGDNVLETVQESEVE